ncbi:hypothetical protein KGF54_005471 [Candida jiufengensis]|uniref:uncharacterized protein n=1 Tax=Candida jiufengensis TaxID=497108 RepID=UPI0022253E20|nr:uncharacterized protein KGF54_005471 [Candida jiufengensis]KAI5949594.1 hypothetical protein KGF54_005471 [Candida jiufengensis]
MVFKFSIDDLFDKYLPSNQLYRLPRPISHFLGYHKPPHKPTHDYWIWLETLIGTFCGLSLLMGIFKNPNIFTDHHHAPIILASYGASAILCFNASQVPLAQPRNVLVGHFISALIGMSVQKLFSLSETGQKHYWASAAISVSISSIVMSMTNCIHPPAGASAILPSIDEQIRSMSWWYLPVQIISSVLIIVVACITGNVFRSYPVYWWSAGAGLAKKKKQIIKDEETEVGKMQDNESNAKEGKVSDSSDYTRNESNNDVQVTETNEEGIDRLKGTDKVVITMDAITIPEYLDLGEVERDWLVSLQSKLCNLENEPSTKVHSHGDYSKV